MCSLHYQQALSPGTSTEIEGCYIHGSHYVTIFIVFISRTTVSISYLAIHAKQQSDFELPPGNEPVALTLMSFMPIAAPHQQYL